MKLIVTLAVTAVNATQPYCSRLQQEINNVLATCWGCRYDPTNLAAHQKMVRPMLIKYKCECEAAYFARPKCQGFRHYAKAEKQVKYPSTGSTHRQIQFGQPRL